MYQLVAHPVTANRMYLAAQSGLWVDRRRRRSTWTKVGGGLPGAQCRSVAVAPDGATLYASIQSSAAASNGVWRSTNGGTSWTRVYDAQPVKRLAVDWKRSPETIYVQLNQGSGPDMVVAQGPSGPWVKPPVTPMLGYESDAYHQRLSTSSRYDGLIAHGPAGVCVVNAVGRIFRSDDGGASFRDSSLGFTGINFAAQLTKLAVDPSNPDRFAIAVQDVNLFISTDRGRSATMRRCRATSSPSCSRPTTTSSRSPRSSYGIAILPSGRIVLSIGTATMQGLVSTDDGGAQLPGDPVGAGRRLQLHRLPSGDADGGGRRRAALDRRRHQLPDGARLRRPGPVGRRRALRALGQQRDHALGELGERHPDLDRVLREPGLDPEVRPQQPPDGGRPARRVHRLDRRRRRRPDPGAEHRRAAASAQVTSFPLKGQAWGGPAADFGIADIARDPNEPSLVYVTLFGSGHADDLARADRGRRRPPGRTSPSTRRGGRTSRSACCRARAT